MVLTCNTTFNEDSVYEKYFSRFPDFTLSDFQKWAIKGIVENQHILITAHTGSGKTLAAEFAIQHHIASGKKVIYTTPIKALSNTKLSELRRKYPDISFGIITGDVKDNPEADVIIMTTEILRNTLFNKKIQNSICNKVSGTGSGSGSVAEYGEQHLPLAFEMDIDIELAAVVFDEVHYINDEERGAVWEQSLLLLPPHVQLIMLSATIDKPEKFANWVEQQKRDQVATAACAGGGGQNKEVYLIPTNHRVVPLTHYMWITTHENTLKKLEGDPIYSKITEIRNKPVVIKSPEGKFSDVNFYKVNTVKNYLEQKRCFIKRQYILNDLTTYMKRNKHLPAICFVFSRRHVEICAKEISNSLFDEDSIVPNTIEDECKKILMSKLPNYKEYLHLPEYTQLIGMLKKGVAIHHAGLLSVLKEMVELLFDKGYIKLLFATETFAVGINVPAKSTIFTSLQKYNGSHMRNLYAHEYTQMAGRAGRRGIDTRGLVWILGNLIDIDSPAELRMMITGDPPSLSSKFKISIQLALHILSAGGSIEHITRFTETSLMNTDILSELKYYDDEAIKLKEDVIMKKNMLAQITNTPVAAMADYTEKKALLKMSANKQRKRLLRDISTLETDYRTLLQDVEYYNAVIDVETCMETNITKKQYTESYINNNAKYVTQFLKHHDCVVIKDNEIGITPFGKIASQIQEAHPLVITRIIIDSGYFKRFSSVQIATVLSCFTNIAAKHYTACDYSVMKEFGYPVDHCTEKIEDLINDLRYSEMEMIGVETGTDFTFQKDLQHYIYAWCNADDEEKCKIIIQDLKRNTGVFLGDFIKAILKICNIVSEIEKICEMMGQVEALEKIQAIHPLLMKYVATNISLYI